MASTSISGWPRLVVLGIVGLIAGWILSAALPAKMNLQLRTRMVIHPAEYQLPRFPGGTSLRMAMIHDVLLDRYLHHGSAWYEKRNEQARQIIAAERAKGGEPSIELLEAMDDLAVGLENLHKSDEAAEVMREKLRLMPAMEIKIPEATASFEMDEVDRLQQMIDAVKSLSPGMQHQYTARANLGTSLIHGGFAGSLQGQADAQMRMGEGLRFIRESIILNPAAHFGRETWQAIVVRHFLVAQNQPDFLITFDMVGNRLGEVHPDRIRHASGSGLRYPAALLDAQATVEQRLRYRQGIPTLTADHDWLAAVQPDTPMRVPFDEPVLALMGMWMLGGGPNPHSAMALANIALQLGQLEIAWDGYERALEMQSRFSQNESVRQSLAAFCEKQQKQIADILSTGNSSQWMASTRKRHADELAWGRQYQKDYQEWEAKQIIAGVRLDDPAFYDGFFKNREAIASPVGTVDYIATRYLTPDGPIDAVPLGLLGGGMLMMLGALTSRRVARDR